MSNDVAGFTARLTYFRLGGKYYAEGEFFVPGGTLLGEVWEEVRSMIKDGRLPGLVRGARNFLVLVQVPGHPNDHPRLLVDEGLRKALINLEKELAAREPGDLIARCACPRCGADLEITHGDDEGEIGVIG